MTNRVKKADHGTPGDLISDLPRNVIDCILEHLPILDAVRTSILSWKWRYMWCTMPRLEFDEVFYENILPACFKEDEIPGVITEVLLLHNGPIREFILSIPDVYHYDFQRGLTQWILVLSRRGIKHLELLNHQEEPYEMPSHLFSCLTLTYLRLERLNMSSRPNFAGFKSLIELHMSTIEIDSATLESLTSGCPLLEVLTIIDCWDFDYVNISAPCLKVLILEEVQVKSICFEKSKNPVDLTSIHSRPVEDIERAERSNLVNLFSSLPKIEKLHLMDECIQILTAGCVPLTLPNLIYSLKHLKLKKIGFSKLEEISLLVCLLKSTPNLVELELEIYDKEGQQILNCFDELACNSRPLVQLQTVIIVVYTILKPAMDLVTYLLANSPLLKILTLKIAKEQSDARTLLRVSQDLLQIERASPKAKVNFLHRGL